MLEYVEAAEFGGRSIRLPKRLNVNGPPILVLLVAPERASASDPPDEVLFAEALEAVAGGRPMYWLRQGRPQRLPSGPRGRVVKAHELNLINMCYLEQGKVAVAVTELCMQLASKGIASPSSIFVELHNCAPTVEAGVLAKVLGSLQRLTLILGRQHFRHRYSVVVTAQQSVANARLSALFTEYIAQMPT